MQVNLFKFLAITAALSTVQSVPVETAEGSATREQIDKTHIDEAVVDDAVPQKGCVREKAPHISTREKVGGIFARACYDHHCTFHWEWHNPHVVTLTCSDSSTTPAQPEPYTCALNVPPLYVKPFGASSPRSGETEKSRIPGWPQTGFDDAYLPYYPHQSMLIAGSVNIT
ncbi:hypothetical protein HG530_011772 [Fusarium avenaceum]|nr:hypothetical protein HG530_011772 [Fusarium avenaceum]